MIFREVSGALGAVTPGPGDIPVQGGYIHTNPDGSQCFLNEFLGNPYPGGGFCFPIETCPPGFHHPYTAPLSCEVDEGGNPCAYSDPMAHRMAFTPPHPLQCFSEYGTDIPPSRSKLPVGSTVEWPIPFVEGSRAPYDTKLVGTVMDGGFIRWGNLDEITFDRLVKWSTAAYPSDEKGICQAGYWPMPDPSKPYGYGLNFVPCMPQQWLDTNLDVGDAEQPYVDLWRRIVASLKSQGQADHAAKVESGELPFFQSITNAGRSYLNDYNATVDGKTGRVYNDTFSMYYGSKTGNKVQIHNRPYFDGDFDVMKWFTNPFDVIGAVVEDVVDIVKDFSCGPAGDALANAYGPIAVAAHKARCGQTTLPGGSLDSGFPTWGYFAAGGALLLGLGAVAFWPRKKGKG